MFFYTPTNSQPQIPKGKMLLLQPWPNYLNGKLHSGIDLYARFEKEHYPQAVEDGKIIAVVPGTPRKVGCVVIEGESSGMFLCYKHIKTKKRIRELVRAGDQIGFYDDSGRESGYWNASHLHFQIVNKNKTNINMDPVLYLITLDPRFVFMMRDDVRSVYRERSYYSKMIIEKAPW